MSAATARYGLPPVTLDLVIGVTGERNEPVTAEHLNTGISAQEAAALTVRPPQHIEDTALQIRGAAYLALAGAALGFGGSYLVNNGTELPQIAGVILGALSFSALAIAVIIGARALLKKGRHDAAMTAFGQAVKEVLRFQDKLICLPFISGHEHYSDVNALRKALEHSRAQLINYAGDGRVVGKMELLAALEALGDYALSEDPTMEQYVAAHDRVREFVTVEYQRTRQYNPHAFANNEESL